MIELEDVRKTFTIRVRRGRLRRERRHVEAVAGITLSIERGELVGYVGPNGAGKSTTVKMLTGILVPTSGRISVAGLEPTRRRIELARRIGVMFGQRIQLWWDLPLRDSFELLRHVYRVPEPVYRRNLDEFVEALELAPLLDVPVRQLSLGQRIRGELTGAMLHGPEIIFLDEPTIGLDVVAKQAVRDFLSRVNRERGVTVLLTSHDLGDIERLCRRLIVIDHGRLIYDGGLDELKRRYGTERTLVVDLEEAMPPLDVPGARVERVEGPRQWLRFRRDEVSAARLTADVAAQARLVDLSIEETDIEEVVRRIYRASGEAGELGPRPDDERVGAEPLE
jgi:ABC-2 type transport system ATP-binding protein